MLEVLELEGIIHSADAAAEAEVPILGDVHGREGMKFVSVCMAAKVGEAKGELEAWSGSDGV